MRTNSYINLQTVFENKKTFSVHTINVSRIYTIGVIVLSIKFLLYIRSHYNIPFLEALRKSISNTKKACITQAFNKLNYLAIQ